MHLSKEISLNSIISRGNLIQIQDRIRHGERLYENPRKNNTRSKSAVELAVKTGFHGMVDLLLSEAEWSIEDLGNAIHEAASMERDDLVWLLLSHNAPASEARFADIIGMMNLELIDRFLEEGKDFGEEDAFFEALSLKRARPLLRIYKAYRKHHPVLEDQIAKALVEAVRHKRIQWAILLLWAGANPDRRVPDNLRGRVEDDSLNSTTAIHVACHHCDLEYFDTLKFSNDFKNLRVLLWCACICRKWELIEKILERVPSEDLNEPGKNSCSGLEVLVSREENNHKYYTRHMLESRAKNISAAIGRLLQAGAKWNPQKNDYRHDRQGLASHGAKHVVRVIRLLMETPGATKFKRVWDLSRTNKIKVLIQSVDYSLWRELHNKAKEEDLLPHVANIRRRLESETEMK